VDTPLFELNDCPFYAVIEDFEENIIARHLLEKLN
jgi:hypothetical protein